MELRIKNTLRSKAIKVKLITISVIILVLTFNNSLAQQKNQLSLENKKNTVLAVALSLQPLPIDFGNFYAGYWEKAFLYSAGELALFIPGAVMLSNGSNTSETDKLGIYTLIGTYVLLKIISAFDVGIRLSLDNRNVLHYSDQNFTTLLNFNINL